MSDLDKLTEELPRLKAWSEIPGGVMPVFRSKDQAITRLIALAVRLQQERDRLQIDNANVSTANADLEARLVELEAEITNGALDTSATDWFERWERSEERVAELEAALRDESARLSSLCVTAEKATYRKEFRAAAERLAALAGKDTHEQSPVEKLIEELRGHAGCAFSNEAMGEGEFYTEIADALVRLQQERDEWRVASEEDGREASDLRARMVALEADVARERSRAIDAETRLIRALAGKDSSQ